MSTQKASNLDSSGLVSQIDKKIKNLVKTKESLEKKEKSVSVNPVTVKDLMQLDFADDLAKIKEIQKERMLEDMSLILNDKIKELEQKEKSEHEKEAVLVDLTNALNEKVEQLELSNKQLSEEKQRSDQLNAKLEETVKKLTEAEKELKIERDWLADQVEKKSLEVLDTIDQLIKAENKSK